MDELEGNGAKRLGIDVDALQVNEVHAELVGESRHDVVFAGVPLLDKQLVERFPGDGGVGHANSLHVGRLDDAVLNETLEQLHAILGVDQKRGGSNAGLNPLDSSE